MDKIDSDLVNLHDTQADLPDVARVHLRSTQEDTRMVKPEIVDRIRELSGQRLGSKRIAREVGVSRNSVRRYLAGATAGFQERPAARRLDAATLREVRDLFGTVAEGNTVVIQQELARRGLHVELRTLQRAVGPLRQEQRAQALATVRFETPPKGSGGQGQWGSAVGVRPSAVGVTAVGVRQWGSDLVSSLYKRETRSDPNGAPDEGRLAGGAGDQGQWGSGSGGRAVGVTGSGGQT